MSKQGGVGEPRVLDDCFGDPWVWSEGADHSDALASNDWILIKAPALRALAAREVGEGLRERIEKLSTMDTREHEWDAPVHWVKKSDVLAALAAPAPDKEPKQ